MRIYKLSTQHELGSFLAIKRHWPELHDNPFVEGQVVKVFDFLYLSESKISSDMLKNIQTSFSYLDFIGKCFPLIVGDIPSVRSLQISLHFLNRSVKVLFVFLFDFCLKFA